MFYKLFLLSPMLIAFVGCSATPSDPQPLELGAIRAADQSELSNIAQFVGLANGVNTEVSISAKLNETGTKLDIEILNNSTKAIKVWEPGYSASVDQFQLILVNIETSTYSAAKRKVIVVSRDIPSTVDIEPGGSWRYVLRVSARSLAT